MVKLRLLGSTLALACAACAQGPVGPDAEPAPGVIRLLCSEQQNVFAGRDEGVRSRIAILDPAGVEEPRFVVHEGYNFMPVARRGGGAFAYLTLDGWDRSGQPLTRLVEASADGTSRRTLRELDAPASKPEYSPDDEELALAFGQEVHVLSLASGSFERLTTTTVGTTVTLPTGETLDAPPASGSPSYSPDGSQIVYASTQSGHVQIWVMDRDGSNRRQLTDGLGTGFPHANVPHWSPAGGTIAFWSGVEANYGEVWTVGPDGSNPTQHTSTEDPQNSDVPYYSPDGARIVFHSNRDGEVGLYVLETATDEIAFVTSAFEWCNWIEL